MLGWLIFAVILAVVSGVLTIVWWRVGDIWADEENKRFRSGGDDADSEHSGPVVIRGFGAAAERPADKPD